MMKTLSAYVLLLFLALALLMCRKKDEHAQHDAAKYTCSMHPQIIQDKPGSCQICEMNLVKMDDTTGADGSIMLNESQIRLANITTTLTRFENMGENTLLTGKLTVNEEQTEV